MNALVQAIPSIFNVLLVCLIFWLIFAIMGVQLFSGKYYRCIDEAGVIIDYRLIPDKAACMREKDNNISKVDWLNANMNFDHVGKAYLSLFQVATFKGWIPIMNSAIDSRQVRKYINYPFFKTSLYMLVRITVYNVDFENFRWMSNLTVKSVLLCMFTLLFSLYLDHSSHSISLLESLLITSMNKRKRLVFTSCLQKNF